MKNEALKQIESMIEYHKDGWIEAELEALKHKMSKGEAYGEGLYGGQAIWRKSFVLELRQLKAILEK